VNAPLSTRCPACGASPPPGKFCNTCGAALMAQRCRSCGSEVRAGVRFCGACGAPAGAGAAPAASAIARRVDPTAGLAGGLAVALCGLLLFMLLRRGPGGAATVSDAGPVDAAPAAAGAPPDISSMSPRERFDRLFNRIMQAAESGDESTVTQFTPMALMAYGQLPDVDADARYHAALLKAHTGDPAGAEALGDSILAQSPGHLFGYMARGAVARYRKDDKSLGAAYQGFLQHYDAEMKANRPEYGEHSRAVADFRTAALGARGGAIRGKAPGS
jgi:hypothetical protein